MFEVMSTCPEKQQEVPVGIRVTNQGHWDTMKVENSHYQCPACGGAHLIVREEAVLHQVADG
jgi:predicted RNA-binding Zn-ribbon protein involved in translation (DUF1610 family)